MERKAAIVAGGLTREEVAAILGISKTRVEQIELRALRKCRKRLLEICTPEELTSIGQAADCLPYRL